MRSELPEVRKEVRRGRHLAPFGTELPNAAKWRQRSERKTVCLRSLAGEEERARGWGGVLPGGGCRGEALQSSGLPGEDNRPPDCCGFGSYAAGPVHPIVGGPERSETERGHPLGPASRGRPTGGHGMIGFNLPLGGGNPKDSLLPKGVPIVCRSGGTMRWPGGAGVRMGGASPPGPWDFQGPAGAAFGRGPGRRAWGSFSGHSCRRSIRFVRRRREALARRRRRPASWLKT